MGAGGSGRAAFVVGAQAFGDLALQVFGQEDLRRAAMAAIDQVPVFKDDGKVAADAGVFGHVS